MMKTFKSTDNKFLTLKLFDGKTNAFVRAKIFDSSMNFIGAYSLGHIDNGLYAYQITFSVGNYYVTYEVFKDSGYTVKDRSYADAEEFIRVQEIESLLEQTKDLIIDTIDDSDGQIA